MARGHGRAIQRADTEETRRAILRAAHNLFMELGYRAVTTRMVADASGVKQPLLYYHFADKEALYLEVQREQSMAYKAALERIVPDITKMYLNVCCMSSCICAALIIRIWEC